MGIHFHACCPSVMATPESVLHPSLCHRHPIHHHPFPDAGGTRSHSRPIRRPAQYRSQSRAIPFRIHERLPFLPARLIPLQRLAPQVASLGEDRTHHVRRLPVQHRHRVHPVPLCSGPCRDGRRDLQHAGRVYRLHLTPSRPCHRNP